MQLFLLLVYNFNVYKELYIALKLLKCCLWASPLGRTSPTKRAGFHLAFTWEKLAPLPGLARLAESPGLTTFIFPRNPESDICILYPTHKQTELVK